MYNILMTGACGGLGQSTLTLLVENGYRVFALDIDTEPLQTKFGQCHSVLDRHAIDSYIEVEKEKMDTNVALLEQEKDSTFFGKGCAEGTSVQKQGEVILITCDITSDESVRLAYQQICQYTDELYAVINFAGSVCIGSLIEVETAEFNRLIQINLLGMYRINKQFYPLMRTDSRYLNISSEYGVLDAIPFHSFYTATKHAVEIYNDGLRRELNQSKIKVVAIRPGAFKTNMQGSITSRFEKLLMTTTHYKAPLQKLKKLMDAELVRAKSPIILANVVIKILRAKSPKRYYAVGTSVKMKCLSFLPSGLQDFLFRKILG